MLETKDAVANIAVHNLDAARRFYEGTLGFKPVDRQGEELIVFGSGKTTFNVYRSEHAGTNRATSLTWMVDDVIKAVDELKGKGVAFEHYEIPDMKREGDVHICGDMKVAWFKDPDGNILNVVSH